MLGGGEIAAHCGGSRTRCGPLAGWRPGVSPAPGRRPSIAIVGVPDRTTPR